MCTLISCSVLYMLYGCWQHATANMSTHAYKNARHAAVFFFYFSSVYYKPIRSRISVFFILYVWFLFSSSLVLSLWTYVIWLRLLKRNLKGHKKPFEMTQFVIEKWNKLSHGEVDTWSLVVIIDHTCYNATLLIWRCTARKLHTACIMHVFMDSPSLCIWMPLCHYSYASFIILCASSTMRIMMIMFPLSFHLFTSWNPIRWFRFLLLFHQPSSLSGWHLYFEQKETASDGKTCIFR